MKTQPIAMVAAPREPSEWTQAEPLELPRRFAAGTNPATPTYVGGAPARPSRTVDDDHTATDLTISDHTATDVAIDPTIPNLSIADRTKPGLVLPSVRGRAR